MRLSEETAGPREGKDEKKKVVERLRDIGELVEDLAEELEIEVGLDEPEEDEFED